MNKVAITGSDGYIGGLIRAAFLAGGWEILDLTKEQKYPSRWYYYDLTKDFDFSELGSIDCLVHAAHVKRKSSQDEATLNVHGAKQLFRAAREAGVPKIIFMSSIDVFIKGQKYGRVKREVEVVAEEYGALIVRAGLVYNKDLGGLWQPLRRLSKLPVAPVPSRKSLLYLVNGDELAQAVVKLANDTLVLRAPLTIAYPVGYQIRQIVRELALTQNKSPMLIGISWRSFYFGVRGLEKLRLNTKLNPNSILGLSVGKQLVVSQKELQELGIKLSKIKF